MNHDLAIERQLLGKLLTTRKSGQATAEAVISQLQPEHFVDREVADCIAALKQTPFEDWHIRLLLRKLVGNAFRDQHEAVLFLTSLLRDGDFVPGVSHMKSFARLVITQYHERREQEAILSAQRDTSKGLDPSASLQEAAHHRQRITALDRTQNTETPKDFVASLKEGQEFGLSTGLIGLDQITNGYKPGELIVVGAKSGGGKSIYALQVAIHANEEGHKSLFVSLEMSKQEIYLRAVANITGIHQDVLTNPTRWSSGDEEAMNRAAEQLEDLDIIDDEHADITVEQLNAIVAEGGYRLVVVDYLQLMMYSGPPGDSREREVAWVSRNLKQLAGRHQCTVLAPVQLNDDGRVRESRAVFNDSNVLLKVEESKGGHRIFIEKNRAGQAGSSFEVLLQASMARMVAPMEF